jgi:acyl carrier protein
VEEARMIEDVAKELMSIIAEIAGVDEEHVTPDSDFSKDLEIDSIKAIEVTVAIEKRFKVSVRDEDVPRITTVRNAIDLVNELLDQKVSASVSRA